jgi:hypothetical protein
LPNESQWQSLRLAQWGRKFWAWTLFRLLVLSGSAAHVGGFEAPELDNLRQISTVSPFSNVDIVILSKLKITIPSEICVAYQISLKVSGVPVSPAKLSLKKRLRRDTQDSGHCSGNRDLAIEFASRRSRFYASSPIRAS